MIEDISDHMALSCDNCGSTGFCLLKSGKIECKECTKKMPHIWEFNECETKTQNQ